jgi:hypothetical protein
MESSHIWKRLDHPQLLLHHNNAPANTSLKTTESVTNKDMVIVPHPPYSLKLAPCDFALLSKLEIKLKR